MYDTGFYSIIYLTDAIGQIKSLTNQISNLHTPVMPFGSNSDIHLKRPVLTAGKSFHRMRCRCPLVNWSLFWYWSSSCLICRIQLGLQCIESCVFEEIIRCYRMGLLECAMLAQIDRRCCIVWCGELICLANGKHE